MTLGGHATDTGQNPDDQPASISPQYAQDYITDMLGELGLIARQAGLAHLSNILKLAKTAAQHSEIDD